MSHTCHAFDCPVRTKPELFMCLRHWRMLPKLYQRGIWTSYRPGQCDDWAITQVYADRAKACVRLVADKEGKTIPEGHVSLAVYDHCAPDETGPGAGEKT